MAAISPGADAPPSGRRAANGALVPAVSGAVLASLQGSGRGLQLVMTWGMG